MGLRASLHGAENIAYNGIRSRNRPVRSDSLYRLSYPGPPKEKERERESRVVNMVHVVCERLIKNYILFILKVCTFIH